MQQLIKLIKKSLKHDNLNQLKNAKKPLAHLNELLHIIIMYDLSQIIDENHEGHYHPLSIPSFTTTKLLHRNVT